MPWEIKGFGDIKMADIGTGHIVALREDGTVWTWVKMSGDNWVTVGSSTTTFILHVLKIFQFFLARNFKFSKFTECKS